MPAVVNEAVAAKFPRETDGRFPNNDAVATYLGVTTPPAELRPVHGKIKVDQDSVSITLFPRRNERTCINLLELRFANPGYHPVQKLVESIDLIVGKQLFDRVYIGPHLDALLEYHGRSAIAIRDGDNGVPTSRVPLPLLSTHARDLLPNLQFHDINIAVNLRPGQRLQDIEVWAQCFNGSDIPHKTLSGQSSWLPDMAFTSMQTSMGLECGVTAVEGIMVWGVLRSHISKILINIGKETLVTWTPDPPFSRQVLIDQPDACDPRVRVAMGCLDALLPSDIVTAILDEAFVADNKPVIIRLPEHANTKHARVTSIQLVQNASHSKIEFASVSRNVPRYHAGLGGLAFAR